jgi:hypothetical protein
MTQIREGIAEMRAMGTLVGLPSCFGAFAEGCARCGHIDEGLAAFEEALAMADTAATGSACQKFIV